MRVSLEDEIRRLAEELAIATDLVNEYEAKLEKIAEVLESDGWRTNE